MAVVLLLSRLAEHSDRSARECVHSPAPQERPMEQQQYRNQKPSRRPSDRRHYAQRFLSIPSRTDGTVEVALIWGDHVMAETALGGKQRELCVGPEGDQGFRFDHPSLASSRQVLVSRSKDDLWTLHLTPTMRGDVYLGTRHHSVEAVIEEWGTTTIPLTARTRARLEFDGTTVLVHQGTRPLLALPSRRADRKLGGFLLFSGVIHAVVLAMVFLAVPNQRWLDVDSFDRDEGLVQIEQIAEQPLMALLTPTPPAEAEEPPTGDDRDPGVEAVPDERHRAALREPDTPRPEAPVDTSRDRARSRGVLAAMPDIDGSVPLFGTTPVGLDDVMAFGADDGPTVGPVPGAGGIAFFERDGTRTGGLPMSPFEHGRPTAFRPNADERPGEYLGSMRDRPEETPGEVLGTPEIDASGYDRAIIQRVVRQHRREIRACYEGELQQHRDLVGRVVVTFIIDAAGRVASAAIRESDVDSDDLESCLLRRIRRWSFPPNPSARNSRVIYPFVFTRPD